jgi:Kef-type K+ transport system membrane component KefB
VFGALYPSGFGWLLPAEIMPQLNALAQLGVILFVFVAGLEVDLSALRRHRTVAVVVSHVSVALPFLLGIVLALITFRDFAGTGTAFPPFALFLGCSMSVTALPVLRILAERKLLRSTVGTVALTCALVDDVTAWFLLAIVVAVTTATSPSGVLATVVLTAGFVATLVLVVRPAARRACESPLLGRTEVLFPGVLAVLLLAALASDRIGVHSVFGAFAFGLACPGGHPAFKQLRARIDGLATGLLLPIFFANSGLRSEIGLLGMDAGRWRGALPS